MKEQRSFKKEETSGWALLNCNGTGKLKEHQKSEFDRYFSVIYIYIYTRSKYLMAFFNYLSKKKRNSVC